MELKIETDFLIKNKLTPTEGVILNLLHEKKNRIIKSIVDEMPFNPFEIEIPRLKSLGYIEGETILSLKLTEEGTDLIEARDFFQELLEIFPHSVIRKDGKKAYLRTDKKRSQSAYIKITRKRRDIHEYILECLKYEINQREQSGDMMWFKALPNWLKAQEWETWGERMKEELHEEKIKQLLGTEKQKEYGEELE